MPSQSVFCYFSSLWFTFQWFLVCFIIFWFYTEHFVHNNSRVWSKLYFFPEKDMSLHVQIGRLGVWVNLICSWAWSGIYCSFSLIQFITCFKYLEHSIIIFPSVGISGWILVRFFFVLNSQPAGFQNCT